MNIRHDIVAKTSANYICDDGEEFILFKPYKGFCYIISNTTEKKKMVTIKEAICFTEKHGDSADMEMLTEVN